MFSGHSVCYTLAEVTRKEGKEIILPQSIPYHSVIKKGILPFEAACIDFKCILLSKIYHIEKDKFHIMSLIYGI